MRRVSCGKANAFIYIISLKKSISPWARLCCVSMGMLSPKEEREYETKAAERKDERRRKEEEAKRIAVTKTVSAASGQVRSADGVHSAQYIAAPPQILYFIP